MTSDWPFHDPPNVASFTTEAVLNGAPVLYVTHDFDGDWQFHGPDSSNAGECKLVSLGSMIEKDGSLRQLHDLPYGWCATRNTVDEDWVRENNTPFPSFEDDGFYLEDAVWLSQFHDDINPPSEQEREHVLPGSHVKLVFRFEAEDSERKNRGVERMWVLVTEADEENGVYSGTVANDPHHADVLSHGDVLQFHPLHIAEIDTD